MNWERHWSMQREILAIYLCCKNSRNSLHHVKLRDCFLLLFCISHSSNTRLDCAPPHVTNGPKFKVVSQTSRFKTRLSKCYTCLRRQFSSALIRHWARFAQQHLRLRTRCTK